MKVAHFNTFPYGGAATAAKRIHHSLLNQKVDSRFYFYLNDKEAPVDDTYLELQFEEPEFGTLTGPIQRRIEKRRQREIYRLFNEHIAIRRPDQETFSMAELPESTHLDWENINADIVHLHWISFLADYPSFFRSIPRDTPIVWTLHDQNAFTGGCHYTNGCSRFRYGCGGCPQIANSSRKDVSYHGFLSKQKSLRGKQIHVVTPSTWLGNQAMQSKIWPTDTTFHTIRYGLELDQYFPVDKSVARAKLGLPQDSVLIGFGAEDVNNKRKGMHHLQAALKQLATQSPIEAALFGSGELTKDEGMPKTHELGYLSDVTTHRLFYSAVDIVVVPSREDNQPQVGLEAMACGTPVVGFNAGGIPEYVRDGTTGLLANLGDEQHLADRIQFLIDNEEARKTMGRRARLMMESEFEFNQQAQRYATFYQNIAFDQRRIAA